MFNNLLFIYDKKKKKLFRNDNGIEPFIGIIVTPFYNHINKSKINVFTVGKDFDTSNSYRNYYFYIQINILMIIIFIIAKNKIIKNYIFFKKKKKYIYIYIPSFFLYIKIMNFLNVLFIRQIYIIVYNYICYKFFIL